MWFVKLLTAYQTSVCPGWVIAHLFCQIWKISCFVYIKFNKVQWSTSNNICLSLLIWLTPVRLKLCGWDFISRVKKGGIILDLNDCIKNQETCIYILVWPLISLMIVQNSLDFCVLQLLVNNKLSLYPPIFAWYLRIKNILRWDLILALSLDQLHSACWCFSTVLKYSL